MSSKRSGMTRRAGRSRERRFFGSRKWWVGGGIAAIVPAMLYAGWLLGQSQGWFPNAQATATDRQELVAKGRQLVVPVDERPAGPRFRIRTASYADGSVFDLKDQRGNVVILYFMAAWCVTCIPEARALADLHEAYAKKGVRILVVDVQQGETEDQLARFRDRAGNGDHFWALDRNLQVVRAYGVRALDTTFVIDRKGRVAYGDAHPTPYDDLAAVVEALLP